MIWSGKRYSVNQNYAENRVPGYSDSSVSLSKEFIIGNNKLNLSAECLNIFDKNYAVVKYFPMPGRSFRGTFSYKF